MQSDGEQRQGNGLHEYIDAELAGCRASTRSTSGGLLTITGMSVTSWSSTQGSIATSSRESEFYTLVRGVVEALGLHAALAGVGWAMRPEFVGSSARRGSWGEQGAFGQDSQHAVRRRLIGIRKVCGDKNPADVLTKPEGLTDIKHLLGPVIIVVHVQ